MKKLDRTTYRFNYILPNLQRYPGDLDILNGVFIKKVQAKV